MRPPAYTSILYVSSLPKRSTGQIIIDSSRHTMWSDFYPFFCTIIYDIDYIDLWMLDLASCLRILFRHLSFWLTLPSFLLASRLATTFPTGNRLSAFLASWCAKLGHRAVVIFSEYGSRNLFPPVSIIRKMSYSIGDQWIALDAFVHRFFMLNTDWNGRYGG